MSGKGPLSHVELEIALFPGAPSVRFAVGKLPSSGERRLLFELHSESRRLFGFFSRVVGIPRVNR